MRNSILTTLTLLLFFTSSAAAGSAVKGVRGTRKLQVSAADAPADKKVKKCKKEKVKDPKAAEPKADPKAAELKEDPKIAGDLKASKDPKAADPKLADAKDAKDTKDAKAAPEVECLEWEYEDRETDGSGGEIVTEPTFGSTGTSSEFQSVNVDCDAIANGSGPTDTDYVSFSVNIDVLKDADSGLQDLFSAMEEEMQNKIAPRIAGCSSSSGSSQQETSKIVNVEFGELERGHSACDSSLGKQAAELDGVCVASDVPVTVYFVGDFPESAAAKVEVAIEEYEWGVDGLLATSEVEITQTGSSMGGGDSGPSPGAFGGIAVAALAVLGLGGFLYYKKNQGAPLAKAELDTDEESSDDEKKIPEVKVMAN